MSSSNQRKFDLYSSIAISVLILITWGISSFKWIWSATLLGGLEKFAYFSYMVGLLTTPYIFLLFFESKKLIRQIAPSSIFNFSYSFLIWFFSLLMVFTTFNSDKFLFMLSIMAIFLAILEVFWLYFTQESGVPITFYIFIFLVPVFVISTRSYFTFYKIELYLIITYIVIPWVLFSIMFWLIGPIKLWNFLKSRWIKKKNDVD